MATHSRKPSALEAEASDGLGLGLVEKKEPISRSASPTDKPLPPPPQAVPAWRQAAPLPHPIEEQKEQDNGDENEEDLPEWRQAAAPVTEPPAPPPKEAKTDAPEWRAATLPNFAADEKLVAPTPPPPTPRIKKKVPWKAGKNIMVLLPMDEDRGKAGKAPKPLTQKDVENIQRDWEQLGYNTKGFNLEHATSDFTENEGQSRSVWPQSDFIQEERGQGNFKVSIPDRAQWDAYVRELSEAKLRALGVSFGDEDPAPLISPAASNMSRQTSMQYPALPFSPPIPTSSATSSHAQLQNPFSPMLMPGAGQSTSQSSNVGSIASPASMHAQMYGKFNPRQSVSFGPGENPFGSPFQFPPQQSPGVWSPQAMPFQPGHLPRGASPSISINNLGALVSPASPFAHEGYFPQNELSMQMQLQQRQQQLQNQLQQQMHRQSIGARASPMLQDVHEDDRETIGKSPSKTPEAFAQPKAKHNASDSLQQEIDDAEYHLEEQFQRQLEHDDYSPHSEKDDTKTKSFDDASKIHSRNQSSFHGSNIGGLGKSRFAEENDGPVLHHPQPHSRGHSLSQRPFDGEDSMKTNLASLSENRKLADLSEMENSASGPSGRASPENKPKQNGHSRNISLITNPWVESDTGSATKELRAGHSTRSSLSKLNVKAPEFVFNPEKAFKPSQFTFDAPVFNPSASVNSAFASQEPTHASDFDFSKSVGARPFQGSKINVDAPVFTPGQSEFSFSSSGPSFRPDAPAFTPLRGNFSDSHGSGQSGGEESSAPRSSSIFGNLSSLLDIVKPPKKNKAVPIVRPDSTAGSFRRGSDDEPIEGKDGRITQGEGRFKRAKGRDNDGDSVPLFANSSMPLQETAREQSPPKETAPISLKTADKLGKENLPSNDGTATPPINPQVARTRNILEDSPDYDGKAWAPWDLEHNQVEDFSSAAAFPVRGPGSFKSNPDAKPVEFKFNAEAKPVEFKAPTPTPETKSGPPKKTHKKSNSSLSALAKPFEFGQNWFKFGQKSPAKEAAEEELGPVSTSHPKNNEAAAPIVSARLQDTVAPAPASKPQAPVITVPAFKPQEAVVPSPTVSAPLKSGGLASSRFASTPPPKEVDESPIVPMGGAERSSFQGALPPASPPQPEKLIDVDEPEQPEPVDLGEPSFEEIDAVMRHMNEKETERSVSRQRSIDTPQFHQPSPMRPVQIPDLHDASSPIRFQPQHLMRSDAPSPSPRQFNELPRPTSTLRSFSRVQEDPFVDDAAAQAGFTFEQSPVHHLNASGSLPASDWDDVLSAGDEGKFEGRTQFFDGHVNELISNIVTDKLNPMHATLSTIQHTLSTMSNRATSSRRRRSVSAEIQESDADDEDDIEITRRSMSPRRDRKMEKIRNIVSEALAAHYRGSPPRADREVSPQQNTDIMQTLQEMKEHFGQSMRLDFRAEDLQSIVEQAVEKRLPASPTGLVDEATTAKMEALEAKLAQMTERNAELTSQLSRDDNKAEEEIKSRRAAEDRLAEVQRLLRISSEEEDRLREAVETKDKKIKDLEDSRSRISVRTGVMEAAADNAQKSHADAQTKLNVAETELRETRQQAQHWKVEAERVSEAAKQHSEEAKRANAVNTELRNAIERVKLQMQESMHTRESMRGKLSALQQGMAQAAHDVSEENAKRFKKEQELIARQEVLDARLQAEARTRERLEREIERLEEGERDGMRAVKESKKLEDLLASMRLELNEAEKSSMRYKREFEEARESGLSEVQRTRNYMQSEIDSANNQVNIVRQDLEEQVSRARAELDHVRLEVDTVKAQTEMLVEEVKESKVKELTEMKSRHEDVLEDLKTRHERDLGKAVDDASRTEAHLLERISLSSAKTEHFQDRISHLEEKLEIAKAAALAAAKSARGQAAAPVAATASIPVPAAAAVMTPREPAKPILALPEKISPQALRESIMVLQEQLQAREQTIEQLTTQISTLDPEAPAKIAKRDDEIVWLRELLSVRIGDLQDIINTCGQDDFDPIAVKDAAIRLKANLQMEEQERERAMNGGSSILPSLLKEAAAASPRVAQVVGPMAAAWGNWRQARSNSNRNIGEVMSASRASSASNGTPSRPSPNSERSFLSGLLTPPPNGQAKSAFGSTGKRFTAEQLANRPRGPPPRTLNPRAMQDAAKGKVAAARQAERQPTTPPMMGRTGSYDMGGARSNVSDHHQGNSDDVVEDEGDSFADDGFFDEDADDADAAEVEDSLLGR